MSLATPSDNRPIVISGPSGVGKSTLCNRLLANYPGLFATTISHTTRDPRPRETHGTAYYFVSRDEFECLLGDGAFIEHTEFNGNLYGTSKATVVEQSATGSIVLLDIEMEGVKQLKNQTRQASGGITISPRFIFIKPPSLDTLEKRLRGRGTEDEDSVQRRLNQARNEIAFAETGVHDKVIVNHDVDAAFRELEDFIFGS